VTAMTSNSITVKFDQIAEPYCVERVKSKFMLMKTFYVYRKHFPLILAHVVIIHKCQGLSLDSAIIDLSSKVFSPKMSYVALSKVRSLNGLHLTDFDSASIIANSSCLEEINRLRGVYRKDLPYMMCLKPIPVKNDGLLLKLMIKLYHLRSHALINKNRKQKPFTQDKIPKTNPPKKVKVQAAKNVNDDYIYTHTVGTVNSQCTTWPNLRYYPVNEEWQRQACNVWE